MIYLFHGSDAEKARAKALAWVAAAREKQPDAAYVRIEPGAITSEVLMEAAGTQGLFFLKTLVLIDEPFSDATSGELLLSHLDVLAESQNPIGILAPKLLAARTKRLTAKAEKIFVFDLKEKKPTRGFNIALVNALANKDGQTLWKELVKAEREGDAPEMLHGLLHWKARDLMQKGGGKWGESGARELSIRLIELLSDARGGGLTLSQSLERFALSL
ncbi:MAG TPA: hypothetical protein VEB18_00945 [Candidatus Paceibacterota bacterium]|nr:hypothetical protein [Candidatus Paceibacterota bacterium]